MIEVKEAVKFAFQALEHLLSNESIIDMALEEVELSEDETQWLVTLGFSIKVSPPTTAEAADNANTKVIRKYKTFRIDANTGNFVSMKIREVDR